MTGTKVGVTSMAEAVIWAFPAASLGCQKCVIYEMINCRIFSNMCIYNVNNEYREYA